MKKWTNLLALALLLFCFSCNEMDKYYDNERHSTSVSVGNAWDYLSSRGTFNHFLTGVEKAGFKSLVSGTGLATIFAPTDEAFDKYFKRHGYSSIDDMYEKNPTELKNMITYHLLYYGFTPSQFMAYNPDGASASQDDNREAGAYHKYRTKSRDEIEEVSDPTDGLQKKVFHAEKYIPVFTTNTFSAFKASAALDYGNLYGENLWNEAETDEKGYYFRVSNAGVSEYGIITDNGYLYILDDVVEPLRTVHQALKENSNYSEFINAYDRFADFTYDADISQTYGNGGRDSLFRFHHIGLPNIADEWLAYTGPTQYNMRYYNTLYAPSNATMDKFFNDYWSKYYNSLDDVNFVPLATVLEDQSDGTNQFANVSSGSGSSMVRGGIAPIFPSNIQAGQSRTSSTNTVVDWSKVDTSIICSNGILYGVHDLVAVPRYFSYVTAPALLDPEYNMFLLLMNKAQALDSYTTENTTFYAFYPDSAMIARTENPSSGTVLEYTRYSNRAGDEDICYSDGEEMPSVSASLASNIVRNHFCDKVIDLPQTDEKIYHTTYGTFNYLYQKGNNIYSPVLYNEAVGHIGLRGGEEFDEDKLVTCEEIDLPDAVQIRNGHVYELNGGKDASAFLSLSGENYAFLEYKKKPRLEDCPKELTERYGANNFFSICLDGQGDTLDIINAMLKESYNGIRLPRFIFFAFTARAAVNANNNVIGKSGTAVGAEAAKNYTRNLYVSVARSRLDDYPFPGDGKGIRTLQTFKKTSDGGYTTFQIRDDGDHLTVIDPTGREAKVLNSFPYIYCDGAIYVLDDYLDFGEYNNMDNIN